MEKKDRRWLLAGFAQKRGPIANILILSLTLAWPVSAGIASSQQQAPQGLFQAAVALYEGKQIAEAREAFTAILMEYDSPENRRSVEFDSLLAGSHYYLGESFFQEDRLEDAAVRYAEVIASFQTFRPESYYHLGLSKHYRQDYPGAIATLAELVAQYAGSSLAPQALYYQGVGYELLKDKAAARGVFQAMIDRYPQHAWTKKAREKTKE